jgi:uncharacterized protein YciI
MRFLLLCEDKPDALELRLANRADHLAYVQNTDVNIVLAGPLLADDQETMAGSLLIIEADTRAQVEAFNREDPYTRAGLFGRVTIHPFKQVLPS